MSAQGDPEKKKFDEGLLKEITRDDIKSLEQYVEPIKHFIESHLIDECGLVYSYTNKDTLAQWTDEELKEYNTRPVCHHHINSPSDYINYENSLMGTGEYASSQLAAYEATKDINAFAAATHQVFAILRVLYQGELFEKGFLPKPFGGIRKCCYSHEISPDQHIKSVATLREFQKYASESLNSKINEYMVHMADYFFARDWIHPRREGFVVTPENRPHVISILVPLLTIAANITNDSKYRDAISRFDKIIDNYANGNFQRGFNLCCLMIEGFNLAIEEGFENDRLKVAIEQLWIQNKSLVLENGLGDPYGTQEETNSESVRFAALASIVDRYHPHLEAWKLAIYVLKKVHDPGEMLYSNGIPDDHVKCRGKKFLHQDALCEMAIASWLLAYWRLYSFLNK